MSTSESRPSKGNEPFSRTWQGLTALALAGAVVLFAWLCLPLFKGEVFVEDDLAAFHLPLRFFYAQALNQGNSFLWMPGILNGFYLHGEGQAAMLHPLHYLLFRGFPFSQAFMLSVLLYYPLIFSGFFAFARRHALAPLPALFGAILFTFIGVNMNHYVHANHVAGLAHLPWQLYAIDVAMRGHGGRQRLTHLLLLEVLTVSQVLQGCPQFTYFAWLVELAYAGVLLLATRAVKAFLLLGVVKLLAIMASMAQLLPTFEAFAHSYRANPGMDFRLAISLHPANLLQIVVPYLFHRRVYVPFKGDEPWDAPYLGAVTIVLLAYLVIRFRRLGEMRLLAGFALALTVFGLIAALGRYGFLYPMLDQIPIVNKLRAPARYVAIAHVGMALGAAIALAHLCAGIAGGRKIPYRQLAWVLTVPALSLGVVGAVILLRRSRGLESLGLLDYQCRPDALLLLSAALVLASAFLLLGAARGRVVCVAGLLLLTLADISLYSMRHKPSQTLEAYLAEIQPPPQARPGDRLDSDIHPMYMNRYSMLGYHAVYGYVSLGPERALDYTQILPLQLAGVTWRETRVSAGPQLAVAKESGVDWVPLSASFPRARLLTKDRTSDDPMSELDDLDLNEWAVLEGILNLGGGDPGSVQILDDRPGEIRLRLEGVKSRQILLVAESYHSGWKARSGGRELLSFPVYGDLLGCVVEPDCTEVTMEFRPESFLGGVRLSLAGIVASSIFFGFYAFSARAVRFLRAYSSASRG